VFVAYRHTAHNVKIPKVKAKGISSVGHFTRKPAVSYTKQSDTGNGPWRIFPDARSVTRHLRVDGLFTLSLLNNAHYVAEGRQGGNYRGHTVCSPGSAFMCRALASMETRITKEGG